MKNILLLVTTTVAGFISAALIESGLFIAGGIVFIWPLIVILVNTLKKSPVRQHKTHDRKNPGKVIPLYSYSTVRDGWRQDANERWGI